MNEKNHKNTLKYVIYYYAIATIQIVLVHSRLMRIENPYWVVKLVDFIRDYHMALFFFISGILLSYTKELHDNIWKWYKGKIIRLLCPYLILTVLAFLPKILLEPILHNGADYT